MALYTMECGVKAMKNPSIVLLAIMIFLVFSACGKKDAPSPASRPMDPPAASAGVHPRPEQAGPADLPPCPGFVSLESSKGDGQSGASVLLSSQSVPFLLDFYTANLAADGWILGASAAQGGEQNLQFRKGTRFLRFQIGPSDNPAGISRIHLAWALAGGTEEDREAYEPEPEAPSDVDAGSREW
jgi:hypothetical protein